MTNEAGTGQEHEPPDAVAWLQIDPRFNGPPASGNGGWVAGSLAARLGAPIVEVSLRAPPPLGVALAVRRSGEDGLGLFDGDTLLAEARAVPRIDLDVPPAPDFDVAEAAGALGRLRAQGRLDSPYATCFGCGIRRTDGLRIIPGPAGDAGVVASTWRPRPDIARPDGTIDAAVTWAALDCPAGIAWSLRLADHSPMMTARMTASVDAPLRAGEPYIVIGWPIVQEGRKLHAGTAIFDAAGGLRARSRQLWLLPRS